MRKIYSTFVVIGLVVGALSVSSAWAANPEKAEKAKDSTRASESGNCAPRFCRCLPPTTGRSKACSSRAPDKMCQPGGRPQKINCETFCSSDVKNCQ